MKKKTPLLLVLAALSATAIGFGAGCGKHEHTFDSKWTRTETEHYHAATCEHDEKKDAGLHDTDGVDGSCSVCNYSAGWTITYVSAHGTTPEAATKQTKLPDTLPALSDNDYDFGGWYLDSACSEDKKAVAGAAINGATTLYAKWTLKSVEADSWTITYVSAHGTAPDTVRNQTKLPDTLPKITDSAFDFGGWYLDSACSEGKEAVAGAAIGSATTLYAKWSPKLGSTAENPVLLQGLGTPALTAPMNGRVYFKYTATAAGRYTVSVLARGEVTEVVSDDDNANVVRDGADYHLTLSAGKSVVITVGQDADSAAAPVSALVNECVNEPLPSEGWDEGIYSDLFNTLNIELKRDGTLIFNGNEENPSRYDYVGGDIDTLTFEAGGTNYSLKYSVKGDDKVITLSFIKAQGGQEKRELVFEGAQAPVSISSFSGKYEPSSDGAKIAGIKLFNIYEDGTGYYLDDKNVKVKIDALRSTFIQKSNKLIWGNVCVITLNIDSQNIVSGINVAITGKSNIYSRISDAEPKAPESLPLPAINAEYRGNEFAIITIGASQQYKNFSELDITDYDGELYTILYKGESKENEYKVKVIKDGESVTAIEFYALDGTTKLDTLQWVNPELHDLPADGEEKEISSDAFEFGGYYFKATEAGTYKLTVSAYDADYNTVSVGLKYNLLSYDYDESGDDVPENGVVQLAAGAILRVTCEGNATINFKCDKLEEGMLESKPIILEDGYAEFLNPSGDQTYYFRFNAPKAGKYAVLCAIPSWDGSETYSVSYTVNGESCGFDNQTYSWLTGFSKYKPYAVIDVPADNLVVNINIDMSFGEEFLRVRVSETAAHSELAFDAENKGTLSASGSYIVTNNDILENEGIEALNLVSDSPMTVTITAIGVVKSGKEISLTKNEMGWGFTVDFTGTVAYEAASKLGSSGNPYKINSLGVSEISNDDMNNDLFILITAPSNKDISISLGGIEEWGSVYYYGFGYELSDGTLGQCGERQSLSVAAGESVTIWISGFSGTIPVRVLEDYALVASELRFTDGTPADGKLLSVATAEVDGSAIYLIKDTNGVPVVVTASSAFSFDYGDGVAVNAEENEGVYSLTIGAGENIAFRVTADGTVTFTATYMQGHIKYPLELVFENGRFTSEIEEATSYTFGAAGSYLLSGSGCNFTLNGGQADSVVDVNAGDVLTVSVNSYYNSAKFTISIAVPADYKGNYSYGNDGTLKIGYNTVTIGEKQYTLTAIDGDVYTFTYTPEEGAAETVTLTLNETERKIGSEVLTPRYMFSEEQAVKYVGTVNNYGYEYVYTLLLNRDGTCSLSIDDGWYPQSFDYEIEENTDDYSFGRYNFTFDADGNVILKVSGGSDIILYAPGNNPAPSDKTIYSNSEGIKLTLSGSIENLAEAIYFDGEQNNNIVITETATPGQYEFSDESMFITGTITVIDNNTILITDSWSGNFTLTLQGATPDTPSQKQVVYSDGAGTTFTLKDGEFGNLVDAIYNYGEGDKEIVLSETTTPGTYSFADSSYFLSGTIKIIDDNTIELDDGFFTCILTKQA